MGQLAFDHLSHAALLQHDQDKARLIGQRAGKHIDELGALDARHHDLDAVFIDRRVGAPDLLDQRQQGRAERDDVGQALALQHRLAAGREDLGCRVGIDDAVILAEHQDRMRQGCEQQVVLDVAARLDGGNGWVRDVFAHAAMASGAS